MAWWCSRGDNSTPPRRDEAPPRGGASSSSGNLLRGVDRAVGAGMSRPVGSGCRAARADGRIGRAVDAAVVDAGAALQVFVRRRVQGAVGSGFGALGTNGRVGGAVYVARRCGTDTDGESGDQANNEWFHHIASPRQAPDWKCLPGHIVPIRI